MGGPRLPVHAEDIKAAILALDRKAGRGPRSSQQSAYCWTSGYTVGHVTAVVIPMSSLALTALPALACRLASSAGGQLQLTRNGTIEPGLSGLLNGRRMRESAWWSWRSRRASARRPVFVAAAACRSLSSEQLNGTPRSKEPLIARTPEHLHCRPEAPVLSASLCRGLRPVRHVWATPKPQDAHCRALRVPCCILLHSDALWKPLRCADSVAVLCKSSQGRRSAPGRPRATSTPAAALQRVQNLAGDGEPVRLDAHSRS
jgi:hypothetical protein